MFHWTSSPSVPYLQTIVCVVPQNRSIVVSLIVVLVFELAPPRQPFLPLALTVLAVLSGIRSNK